MTSQVSTPSSDPTRQDQRRERVKKILATVLFVLLLGWNLFLIGVALFFGAWCFENPKSWTWILENLHSWIARCIGTRFGLALLTLSCTSGGSFFIFRHRYGLALTLMAIPSIWLGIITPGGF